MHGQLCASQQSHSLDLGSDSMTITAFFGTPRFLDGAFLSALRTLGILNSSVNLLSPSSSVVVSSSLCLTPSPMFSLKIRGPRPVGDCTGITMGKLACSASPPRVRCKAYMLICQSGIGVTGSMGVPILVGLGVSASFIICGITGTHCFPSSLSAYISSMSQPHVMVVA